MEIKNRIHLIKKINIGIEEAKKGNFNKLYKLSDSIKECPFSIGKQERQAWLIGIVMFIPLFEIMLLCFAHTR